MFTQNALHTLCSRKMFSGSWKLLSSVCVESHFGQAWKQVNTPSNVSANQNTALDKKVFQNNNTNVQSHLGVHGPLKHDLLCLSLNWTHSRKRIVKVNMLISPRKVKIFSKIFHFKLRLLSSNFKVRAIVWL